MVRLPRADAVRELPAAVVTAALLAGAFALGVSAAGCGSRSGSDAAPGTDAAASDATASDGGTDAAPPGTDAGAPPWICRLTATPGGAEPFGAPVVVSDPARGSHVPSVAARGPRVLVAWHEFDGSNVAHVVFTVAQDGCVGPISTLPETYAPSLRPSVAATTGGWVLAYHANDGASDVVRAIELDAEGVVLGPPATVSAPGAYGAYVDVAAQGADEAFAWIDGTTHYFALRGPAETVAAGPVGTTLISTGALNTPEIALALDGTLHLAFRDGGIPAIEWDTLVVTRPPGGAFGTPANVSMSPGYGSDSVDVWVEPDGTLGVVWAEQDPSNVNAFEASYATRSPAGVFSPPAQYGIQDDQIWAPSLGPGLAAAWNVGTASGGDVYFAAGPAPAVLVLPGTVGRTPGLAIDADGARHLAVVTPGPPAQVLYAWGE